MYNALVIGLGNIGAMYDLNNDKIQTHVKAYATNKLFRLWIYDEDKRREKMIATRYKADVLESINDDALRRFDFVSLCTPTDTHFSFLEKLIKLNIPLIVCEKPLCYKASELVRLKKLYSQNHAKILVNYVRRFLPAYSQIKQHLSKHFKGEKPAHIIVKYRRGFLNNASHAFDTLEFLFGWQTKITKFNLSGKAYDAFDEDPTLTCNFLLNGVRTHLVGMQGIQAPIFEIEIYFNEEKLLIRNSGELVEFYDKKNFNVPAKTWNNALGNYMEPVIKSAVEAYKNKQENNFLSALELNRTLLKFI
jgi:predicted dehydrogenase